MVKKFIPSILIIIDNLFIKVFNVCGCIDEMNRQTQANFECQNCGHSENADVNAAKNILAAGLCRC
jgi:transposase